MGLPIVHHLLLVLLLHKHPFMHRMLLNVHLLRLLLLL